MGFYLRKALSFGPLRFNLSKGGIGVSVGVKGLRVGIGPKGSYLHAGRGGLYYRTALDGGGAASPASVDDGVMVPVALPAAARIPDAAGSDLVIALNAGHARRRLRGTFVLLALIFALAAIKIAGARGAVAIIAVPFAVDAGTRIDRRRRRTPWHYAQTDLSANPYTQLCDTADALAACQGRWRIVAGRTLAEHVGRKQHGGAGHLVERTPITPVRRAPLLLDGNIMPPALPLAGVTLYLLPDLMLVEDATGYAGLRYSDLVVRWQASPFVEDGTPAPDAAITDTVWQHANQDGGPDQRFRRNRRLPVCSYATIHIACGTGFDLALQFSRPDAVAAFADALTAMDPASSSLFDRMLRTAAQTAAAQKLLPGDAP